MSLLAGALVAVLASSAFADVQVYKNDQASVGVGSMIQVLGMGQNLIDPYRNDNRMYLFMKEARLRLSGNYEDYRFRLELGMGPEDAVVSQTGIALGLLDLSFDVPLLKASNTFVRVGQMKVAYGREQLTYSGSTPFGDRSIENLAFKTGRDLGVAVVSQPGPLTAVVGVWTGGGRDVPPNHYLPQKLGFPEVAARIGVGNADGEDPLRLESDTVGKIDRFRAGFYVNGLYTHDSLVGHSSILNVKLTDKSILQDANWNPYIGAGKPVKPGDFWQVGADAIARAPLGNYGVEGELQGDWAGFSNALGAVHTAGGRAQLAVSRGPFEAAARYAVLFPDKQFQANGVALTGSEPIHEVTPSLTWHLSNRNLQLTADAPLLFHAPTFVEKNLGTYVGTELPDESTVVGKNGSLLTQNVVEARLMFQAQF